MAGLVIPFLDCMVLFLRLFLVLFQIELQLFAAVRADGGAFVEHLLVDGDVLAAGRALHLVKHLVVAEVVLVVFRVILVLVVMSS